MQFLASFAILLIALSFWAGEGSTLASSLLLGALAGYGPLRIVWIVLRWSLETYEAGPAGLIVRSGVLRRRHRHLNWSTVRAMDEQAGLLFRFFRLRRVLLIQSDTAAGAVVLRGLEVGAAAGIRVLVDGHASHVPDASDAAPREGTVYRATWRELALMSLVNGRFALLAPPVLLSGWTLLDDVGVRTWALDLVRRTPTEVVVAVSIAAFIVIGTLATVSRYQGFSARMTGAGIFVLSYGLVEKKERRIDVTSIEGVTIRRSFVEQILGRSRLAVLTFRGTDELGASLVLPSLPDATVRQIVRSHFGRFVGDAPILPDRRPAILLRGFGTVTVFVLPVAAALALWNAGVSVPVTVIVALIILGVATAIARMLVSRMSVRPNGVLTIARHLVSESETLVRARACHRVASFHWRTSPRPLLFSLHLYAGGARNYVGAHCDEGDLRRVRNAIADAREPASRRQRQLVAPDHAHP